jgi:hypothetical protein
LKILLFTSLFFASLFGDSKQIYSEYVEFPERVYKGQIFQIVLKTTLVHENYDDLTYKFYGGQGVKLINEEPIREIIDIDGILAVYDKFYFMVKDVNLISPRITLYLNSEDSSDKLSLSSRKIQSIELPQIENFSNIFADTLKVTKVVADRYNEDYNILNIFLSSEIGDIEKIKFEEPYIIKQDYQSKSSNNNLFKSDVVYFVVLPKYYTNFTMKYFNTHIFKIQKIDIPIDVRNDMVTTAKDLRPKILDQNLYIKIGIFITLTILFLMLFHFYQNKIWLGGASIFLAISVIFLVPKPSVCVNGGSVVRILPMSSSTGFTEIEERSLFEKVAERGRFIKISLSESSEGWVRRENVCKD